MAILSSRLAFGLVVLLIGLGVTVGLLIGGDDDGERGSTDSRPQAASASAPASESRSESPTGGESTTDGATPQDLSSIAGVASEFMTKVNTYGPDLLAADGTMPAYRQAVSELLTAEFKNDFFDNASAAEKTVQQAGLAKTATITGSGVSRLDDGAATALVSGSITQSYPKDPHDPDGPRVDTAPTPFRTRIELKQVDGSW